VTPSSSQPASQQSAILQNYEICPKFAQPVEFYIVGHSGGDWDQFCEHSLEGTRWALSGNYHANSIELDISLSSDGVPFLWHDPNPWAPTTWLRSMGLVGGRCKPVFSTSNKIASQMTFEEIKRSWYYQCSKQVKSILRLEEWLSEFGKHPNLKMLWFDIKVDDQNIPNMARKLVTLLPTYTNPDLEVKFSVGRRAGAARDLQKVLGELGRADLSHSISLDTLAVGALVTDASIRLHYDGINKASGPNGNSVQVRNSEDVGCGCCANIGFPLTITGSQSVLRRIANFNIAARNAHFNSTSSYVKIFTWTIDDRPTMEWLVGAGVDGVITNKPKLLAQVLANRNHS